MPTTAAIYGLQLVITFLTKYCCVTWNGCQKQLKLMESFISPLQVQSFLGSLLPFGILRTWGWGGRREILIVKNAIGTAGYGLVLIFYYSISLSPFLGSTVEKGAAETWKGRGMENFPWLSVEYFLSSVWFTPAQSYTNRTLPTVWVKCLFHCIYSCLYRFCKLSLWSFKNKDISELKLMDTGGYLLLHDPYDEILKGALEGFRYPQTEFISFFPSLSSWRRMV